MLLGYTFNRSVVWLPCSIFPYIGNFIIPTDKHIFQRAGEKTPTSLTMLITIKTIHCLVDDFILTTQRQTGWWFGTFYIFPYIGNIHPNWLSYFSEGWPNHQPAKYFGNHEANRRDVKPSGHRFQVAAREQRLKFLENLDVASRFLQVMDLADLALQLSVYPVAIYGWFMVGLWLVYGYYIYNNDG